MFNIPAEALKKREEISFVEQICEWSENDPVGDVIEFAPKASKVETQSISTWAMAVDSRAAAQLEESIMKKTNRNSCTSGWMDGEKEKKTRNFHVFSPLRHLQLHRTRVYVHIRLE